MRRLDLAAVIFAVVPRVASARHLWDQPDGPVYPDELVDRPVVLVTDMTEVSVGAALYDHDVARFVADTPDVRIEHAFGPIAIDASFGPGAALALLIPTGTFPDAIAISAQTTAPPPDKTMFVSQSVTAEHKLVAIPHELAFFVAAGASYNEEHIHAPGLLWAGVVGIDVSAQAEVQLASTLALYGGAGITYPAFSATNVQFRPVFDARAGISLTIANTWDLFTTGTLSGASGSVVLALGAGVTKRFGP